MVVAINDDQLTEEEFEREREAAGDDDSFRVKKSEEMTGKVFRDLDGVVRRCGYLKLSPDKLAQAFGFCRLLDEVRADVFLRQWEFLPDRWIAVMESVWDRGYQGNVAMESVSRYPLTFEFPVHMDKVLLEKFLTGVWSPNNWSEGVSLASFISFKTPLVVINFGSRDGRLLLAKALRGLEIMCSVHFNGLFERAFSSVYTMLEDIKPVCEDFHDIFIRHKLESTIGTFFRDVWQYRCSVEFWMQPMNTPEGCVELLRCYLADFVRGFQTWTPQPHFLWHGSSGAAQNIVVDATTYHDLLFPHLFKPPKKATPNVVSFSGEAKHTSFPSFERPTGNRARFQGIQNVEPCLWHLASQLGMKLKDGTRAQCKSKNCDPILHHVPIDQVEFKVAMKVLESKKWSKGSIEKFKELFKSNKRNFNN